MKAFFALLLFLPFIAISQTKQSPEDIVELIKKNVTCEWSSKTVDTFKAGNSKADVKGVAICMFADMQTLQKAVEKGCNFIITHEPIFYNHLDDINSLANDAVYRTKRKFIEENELVVFRFHDHIHRTTPDGIYEGMLNKLDWKKYAINNSQIQFEFPKTTLAELSSNLKEKLEMKTIRIIGNPEMELTKVGLAVGAPGGLRHIKMLSESDIEVLVAGEAPEWETYSYVNDAITQGRKKAVIFLGHVKSEEAGMEYCADWLKGFVKDVPIYFIENELNFTEM